MKKNKLEYSIHPLWQFLESKYGMEEAFRMFGPYRGANIIPKELDAFTYEVKMPLVLGNTNYVGTHFGGSLYSMCDPFFMFILMKNLGPDYIVWDKSAKIDFLKPGRGTMIALFQLSQEEIDEVKRIVAEKRKTTRFYQAEVKDETGMVVATIEKELYIRRTD
ncbi:MAG: YiiD C-terminal domain-containing protein [Leptospira sp.]|jgi:acyl-coenzyme A thioesterase PaaI-like protein|nr:YiiD C-terminal domain-containing protein [Leptospira sp.]